MPAGCSLRLKSSIHLSSVGHLEDHDHPLLMISCEEGPIVTYPKAVLVLASPELRHIRMLSGYEPVESVESV